MNIDKAIESIESGIPEASTKMYVTQLTGDELLERGLKRRGPGPTYKVCVLEVFSGSSTYASFLDKKLTLALKKALSWRGIVSRRKASADATK
jgi:hypothetical protein